MRRLLRFALACGVAALAACEDEAVAPNATGSIAINVVLAADQPAGSGPTLAPAGHLSSVRARSVGTTSKQVSLSLVGGNWEGTLDGLSPGTYTVVVEGLVGSEVDYYGEAAGVSVTAGQTTTPTITFGDFSPNIADIPSPTTDTVITVRWSKAEKATAYTLQWSTSSAFTTVAGSANLSDTSTAVALPTRQTWYFRARASNAQVQAGRFGDAKSVAIASLTFGGTLNRTSGGFADPVRIQRQTGVTWDGDEFVTLGRKTRAWLVRRTADSLYVLVPNRPITSTDTLWVRNQGPGQMMQAVQFAITSTFARNADPFTAPEIGGSLPFSTFISLSDTTPDHWYTVTSNLPLGMTAVLAFQHPVDLTRRDTVDLDILWTNAAVDQWRGNWDGASRKLIEVSTVAMPPNTRWRILLDKFDVNDSAEVMAAFAVRDTAVFQDIATGFRHSCALKTRGEAFCWGWNGLGALGNGDRTSSSRPVAVTGGLKFRLVAASESGSVSCGVAADSTAYCWGSNSHGQLGNPTFTDTASSAPILVSGGHKWTSISPGVRHVCGQRVDGRILCWGDNSAGQVGDGTFTNRTSPTLIANTSSFIWVDAGGFHTCGVTTGNSAYCWGFDDKGRLGNGAATPAPTATPTLVQGGSVWRSVSGGAFHTCGVQTNDEVYCWGYNADGQLGIGTTDTSTHSSPLKVTLPPTLRVSAGVFHTCAVEWDPVNGDDLSKRILHCWGNNSSGQLGDGSTTSKASPVSILGTYASLRAGYLHSCAVTLSAIAQCWGEGRDGRLGTGDTLDVSTPADVANQGPPAASAGTWLPGASKSLGLPGRHSFLRPWASAPRGAPSVLHVPAPVRVNRQMVGAPVLEVSPATFEVGPASRMAPRR